MKRLEDTFTRHADRVALIAQGTPITYARLRTLIEQRITGLDRLGSGCIAYQLDNGLDWAVTNLALMLSARAGVPVPHFFSTAQRAHVLDDCGAETFIGTEAPDPRWESTDVAGCWRRRNPATVSLPEHTALVTYTSGTTGAPKGVCLSAATLLDTAESVVSVLEPLNIDRHLCVLPLSLLLENVAGLLANLLNGGTTVLEPLSHIGITGSSGLDLGRFLSAQNTIEPHSLILVPQLLLALTTAAELGMALPGSYRFVAVGGARVAPDLLERARAQGIPAYEGYGLTECGSVISLNVPGADRTGSVGRPLPHVALACRQGEIVVSRPTHLGYAGHPDPAAGEVATGDLGELDPDGFLHVAGRLKHHYITAFGRNVSPEWIESELTAELPIGQAAVFGEAEPANVALLVPRMNADEAAIRDAVARCNERLPDYARVRAWQVVEPATFSQAGCLTDNGRVRRSVVAGQFARALAALFASIDAPATASSKEYS